MIAVLVFGEPPTLAFWIALLVIAYGTALLLREEHDHDHTHERLMHEHAHSHADIHYNQSHGAGDAENHIHEELAQHHDHLPDIHHRYMHK